jgi:hypothetical protein
MLLAVMRTFASKRYNTSTSNDEVLPLPGDYHDRRVDNIRSARGAAEFSAGTGKLVVKRNNLNLLAPQEPRSGNRNATAAPGLPHDARRHAESPALG